MENDVIYTLTDNAMYQKVLDETVILDAQTGQYFTLDAITTQIVDLINQQKTIDDVATEIFQAYEAPIDIITQDIYELVDEMLAKRLLKKIS
jgi:hypothetical protein